MLLLILMLRVLHDDVKYCDSRLLSASFVVVVDWCVCCMSMYFSVNLKLRLKIISKNRSECRLFTEIFNSTNVRCCCFSLYNFKRKCNKTTAESTMRERHICEHQNWKFINRKLETTNDKEYECREKKKWKNLRMKGARNYFKTVWLLTVERNHFGLYDFQFQCFCFICVDTFSCTWYDALNAWYITRIDNYCVCVCCALLRTVIGNFVRNRD